MRELKLPSPILLCGAGAVVGLIGLVMSVSNEMAATWIMVTALLSWGLGTVSWAIAKGRNWAWGLLGFSVLGILVIALLEDKTIRPAEAVLDLSDLPPEIAAQQWTCPKCSAETPNTSYRCQSCGYSIV